VLDVGCGTGIAARQLHAAGATIDALGGSFTIAYATVAVTATRTGAATQSARVR
jgi:2-polyprenyl-3-methyl-5-hydroxy-6-metoxy-1,4-benzoquinol methylase